MNMLSVSYLYLSSDILTCTFHQDLVYDLWLCIKKVAVCSIKCSLDPKPFRFKTPLTQRRSQSLRARIRQFRNNDVCYNTVWEILNGLFTPVWSNASPKPMTIFIVRGLLKATFKVWQYQHAWGQIKMLMRLVHHSRLCQGGGGGAASVCTCITLCSLPGSKVD